PTQPRRSRAITPEGLLPLPNAYRIRWDRHRRSKIPGIEFLLLFAQLDAVAQHHFHPCSYREINVVTALQDRAGQTHCSAQSGPGELADSKSGGRANHGSSHRTRRHWGEDFLRLVYRAEVAIRSGSRNLGTGNALQHGVDRFHPIVRKDHVGKAKAELGCAPEMPRTPASLHFSLNISVRWNDNLAIFNNRHYNFQVNF